MALLDKQEKKKNENRKKGLSCQETFLVAVKVFDTSKVIIMRESVVFVPSKESFQYPQYKMV